jgi:hypothetical protein
VESRFAVVSGSSGFRGARLRAQISGRSPSAIQEIRINQNPYTAKYPRCSRRRIEIITKAAADSYTADSTFWSATQHGGKALIQHALAGSGGLVSGFQPLDSILCSA